MSSGKSATLIYLNNSSTRFGHWARVQSRLSLKLQVQAIFLRHLGDSAHGFDKSRIHGFLVMVRWWVSQTWATVPVWFNLNPTKINKHDQTVLGSISSALL